MADLGGRTPRTPQQAALRRHRMWQIAGIALLVAIAATSYLSHRNRLPGARALAGERMMVTGILSGDAFTIHTADGGSDAVQLLGAIAPEPPHAAESQRYLADRVIGREVVLQFDGTQSRTSDGRILALAYLTESECINLALVRDGHAFVDRRVQTYLQSQFAQTEAEARKRARGMWKDGDPDPMPAWRREWLGALKRPTTVESNR
ncbi:MAG: thermonuclease family protein [Burkholderiales bacterium]|nr:thermonuclease family protein [Phycisphaerae bacterium]